MKKTLISLAALMMALPVMAADNCTSYTPLQNLVRNARSVNEIAQLIQSGVPFDEPVRCGGSLTQLAVLRGNPDILQAILKQEPSRANAMVKLDGFPIPGSVREVPLLLFASYYAPNEQMIYRIVESGADISKTDSAGRNLLWYMEQNPVLRNTPLYDNLNRLLLASLAPTKTRPSLQLPGQVPSVGPSLDGGQQPDQEGQQPVEQKASVVEATAD